MNFIVGNNNKLRGAIENLQAIGCSDKEFTEADSNKTTIQNDAVIVTTTTMTIAIGVTLVNSNFSIETGVAVSVQAGKRYFFSGAAPSTWTLDTIANNTGIETWIYNRGTATITVNSNAGANDIYTGGAAVNTFNIVAGAWAILYSDGVLIEVII